MKHYPAPKLDAALKERLRVIADSGATHDELIAEMSSRGPDYHSVDPPAK